MSIHFVLFLYLCGKQLYIYFPLSVFRTSNLENFILYKYTPGKHSGHRIKGVGCNCLISEIAGSNPADCMNVRFLCFLLCCKVSGLGDVLITGIEESYRVCVFSIA